MNGGLLILWNVLLVKTATESVKDAAKPNRFVTVYNNNYSDDWYRSIQGRIRITVMLFFPFIVRTCEFDIAIAWTCRVHSSDRKFSLPGMTSYFSNQSV